MILNGAVLPPGPLVMGVLNVTPDSFTDGGAHLDADVAIAAGLRMRREGADIIDVGGESTRPGSERIGDREERNRILPVIEGLASAGISISVDTMNATTARAAYGAGARIVNDVSGGLADPAMLPTIAELNLPVILMHWRAHSKDMNAHATYSDVVSEVIEEIGGRIDAARAAGIAEEQIAIDPGLGFAKEAEHNWALLRALPQLTSLGYPVLIGASRKRFLGALLADESGPRPADERDVATAMCSALAVERGAWAVRVHDVRGTVDALQVLRAFGESQ